jgi:hypothetical protein
MMEARLIFSYDTNLPAHLAEYFLSINLPVYEAYGTLARRGSNSKR